MADFRCTWTFEGVQPSYGSSRSAAYSWTESWYTTATSLETAILRAASTGPESFIRKRLAFLHASYMLKFVRVSMPNRPGVFKVANIPGAPSGLASAPTTSPRIVVEPDTQLTAAQVQCCVLVDFMRLPAGDTDRSHHRRVLMRGLPLTLVNGNVLRTEGQAYAGLVAFCNYMGRHAAGVPDPGGAAPVYNIRYQDPAITRKGITALAVSGANNRQIIISAPLGILTRNTSVKIQGVQFPRGVNRLWRVMNSPSAPDGGPYTLGTAKRGVSGVWDDTGTATVQTPLFGPPDQYTIMGLASRQTGNGSFGAPRGKHSVPA